METRPGPGWRHVAGAVYEHSSGARLHMLGQVKMPDGEWVSANTWPHYCQSDRFIRIAGGNRKRGLMAWARSLFNRPNAGEGE